MAGRKRNQQPQDEPQTETAKTEATAAEETPQKPERKIVFSPDVKKYGEPAEKLRIGLKEITLPPAGEQLAGFTHPDAELIRNSVRGYKWLTDKGEKS